MTQLVVNADDFGQTSGINAGILDAHRRGIVTSATLMANGSASDEAMRLAIQTPSLGVGVHLNLVEGAPISAPEKVPTLLCRGQFVPKFALMRRHLVGRINLDELRTEVEAQIDRVQQGGISPTHVDSHQHLHAFPPFFSVIARAAESRGVRAIRVPREHWTWGEALRHPQGLLRTVGLNLATQLSRRTLRRMSLSAPAVFGGTLWTGRISSDWIISWLKRLKAPTAELMVHPGYCDEALRQTGTRLLTSRDAELAALTNPTVRETVQSLGIRLIHYGELARSLPISRPPGGGAGLPSDTLVTLAGTRTNGDAGAADSLK